jgi:GTP 3',8-cyclase
MSILDVDSHKLMYHPERVSEWKKNGKCYPLNIEAGITNKCNHKCIQCTLDWINHKNNFINDDVFIRMLDNAKKIGVKFVYFAGEGEPTLHPSLPRFVGYASHLGIKTAISTNGALLTKELAEELIPYLSWIRFSVDAATPETYSEIHGIGLMEFDKVWGNINNFISSNRLVGGKCQVGIQTLLMPENITEIECLAKMSKEIGAHNYQVKPVHTHPLSSYKGGIYRYAQSEISQRLEVLSDYNFKVVVRLNSMERLTQARTYARCHAFDFYCLIDALGNVTPCNIWYGNKDYIFGNIKDQSLQDIWDSARMDQIINSITSKNHCKCGEYRCRQDVMNRYLERIMNPDENDECI